jgi:glutamyl-Q tRNA(Asp) synthetase
LHLGHAYSALLNHKLAETFGGEVLLRIEDIDKARTRHEYIAAIFRDLHWLGLNWPQTRGSGNTEQAGVRHQSEHMADYKTYIEKLNALGLLYPCFATRKEIQAAQSDEYLDPDGAPLYPGLYKNLTEQDQRERMASGTPFALRLRMDKAVKVARDLKPLSYKCFDENGTILEREIRPERWGDVIIARKDIKTSYHLSVVVDDHIQKITHICRGRDLEAATDIHRLLQIILKLDEPAYHHHELILKQDEKLSKSKSHPSLAELRSQGLTSNEIKDAFTKGPEAFNALMTRYQNAEL